MLCVLLEEGKFEAFDVMTEFDSRSEFVFEVFLHRR